MEFSERVRLDRYAIKDPQHDLEVGDLVVASLERYSEQQKKLAESREISYVIKYNDDNTYNIRIDNEDKEVITNVPRNKLEYVVEKDYGDICDRVAGAVAGKDEEYKKLIHDLMVEEKFVPAGRILTGLGRKGDYTLFNCYVYQIPGDSRGAIAEHWGRLFETYSRGGGIGWNLSILRPRGAVVKKVSGRSSGSISWAEQFSQITGVVEQGGCFASYETIETTGGNVLACELAFAIEQGDTVFAVTHAGPKKITASFRNGKNTIRTIEVQTEQWKTRTDVTRDHKIVSRKNTNNPVPGLDGWYFVRAQDLRIGDEVGVLENEGVVPYPICGYWDQMENVETYDFEVEDVHLISSNGVYTSNSRRGAGLQGLEVWHPDIEEFIDVKALRETIEAPDGQQISRSRNLLKNSNISVLITKNFMKAVEKDESWDLVFPDLNDPDYDKEWDGNLEAWKDTGRKVVVYKTVRAKDLWDQIIQRAWEAGEPGLIFLDRANEKSNSYYYDRIVCSNPCGEELLGKNSICNLSHLNLVNFISAGDDELFPEQESTASEASKKFDWDEFTTAIHAGVRFLDTVTDLNKYHEEEVERKQLKERRIGLGILGYGEMLIQLGLRYGSDEAIRFTTNLMKHFSTQSYVASANLAKELGSFPKYEAEAFLKSGFMRKHTKAAREAVEQNGIRNVTLNTIAPTGSVAALLKTTGGCEPLLEIEYTSNTRIGVVEERPTIGQKVASKFGPDRNKWPSYVVTAHSGISPDQHVKTQATMQRWIDASISKTVNMPEKATPEDVATVYMELWKQGCKGGTVYRDCSRDEQVLYVNKNEDETVEVEVVQDSPETAIIEPRPDVGYALFFSESSPVGTVHAGIRHDPEQGEPIDMFVNCGKGDLAADATAIGRLSSMILRWPNGKYVSQTTRLELIRDQLIDLLGRGQEGFGPAAKRSLPDAVAKVINQYLSMEFPLPGAPLGVKRMQDMFDELEQAVNDSDADKFRQIREYVFTGISNGEGDKTYQEEIEAEIQTAEKDGISIPYDYCSACGNYKLVTVPGKCPYCRHCGFTHC